MKTIGTVVTEILEEAVSRGGCDSPRGAFVRLDRAPYQE
jgi:hypothetical protein